MSASWGFAGCGVSGDGDFGEIGSGCGFSALGAEGIDGKILGVDGDASGWGCIFGCVGLVDLVIVR